MNWESIKSAIAKFAPLAGGLLGGPAAPAIGELIAATLGVYSEPEAVLKTLNNPDHILKLKQMELDHSVKLQEMQLTYAQLDMGKIACWGGGHTTCQRITCHI